MEKEFKLKFEKKTFCFTGKLSELKRTQAEREVRSRGGFTIDSVTPQLDYLVIGSTPSPSWKFGKYGSKINHARELLTRQKNKPILVQEDVFMDSLSQYPIIGEGEINEKMIVYKYQYIEEENDFDYEQLEDLLEMIQEQETTFVSIMREEYIYSVLFYDSMDLQQKTKIICRIVKKLNIDDDSQKCVDILTRGFESIKGLDGFMTWYERKEGTSSYVKLLKELPKYQKTRNKEK